MKIYDFIDYIDWEVARLITGAWWDPDAEVTEFMKYSGPWNSQDTLNLREFHPDLWFRSVIHTIRRKM